MGAFAGPVLNFHVTRNAGSYISEADVAKVTFGSQDGKSLYPAVTMVTLRMLSRKSNAVCRNACTKSVCRISGENRSPGSCGLKSITRFEFFTTFLFQKRVLRPPLMKQVIDSVVAPHRYSDAHACSPVRGQWRRVRRTDCRSQGVSSQSVNGLHSFECANRQRASTGVSRRKSKSGLRP